MEDVRKFQHKIAAAKRAWQIMHDPKTVILDSETTGLYESRFVELAVIDTGGNPLLNQRIDPVESIEEKAAEIHGIQPYMLVGQPRFFEIFEDVADAIADKRLVIYNAEFDLSVLSAEISRMSMNLYPPRLTKLFRLRGPHCAMLLYAQFCGAYSDYHGSFTWQKLVKAATDLQVQVNAPAHSALGDTLRTLGVMRGMARWYSEFSNQYEELVS